MNKLVCEMCGTEDDADCFPYQNDPKIMCEHCAMIVENEKRNHAFTCELSDCLREYKANQKKENRYD